MDEDRTVSSTRTGTTAADLLPVGTIVCVTERVRHARRPYVAKVVGYDTHRTKYELGVRLRGRSGYAAGGMWAFPEEVEACEEGQ